MDLGLLGPSGPSSASPFPWSWLGIILAHFSLSLMKKLYLPYILPTDCKEQDIHEEMSVRPVGQPPISNTPRGRHLCSANEAPGPWTHLPRVLFCSCGFSPAPWHQMKCCHVAPRKAACKKTEALLLGKINCCSLRGEVQVRKLRSGAEGFEMGCILTFKGSIIKRKG